MHVITARTVGHPRTPQDIQWMRRNNIETVRRMGQPVIWRHTFKEDDFEQGFYTFQIAQGSTENIPVKRCPACFDAEYEQTRGDCPVCFAIGIVSVEDDPNLYIDTIGRITKTPNLTPAPKYGGLGPSVLTWTIQPDVPEDVFRISERGALIRTQESTVIAPWTPEMQDNDLIVDVELQHDGYRIRKEYDRHVLQTTSPQTIRGFGKYARGREFIVGQSFSMDRLPKGHILYRVPLDIVYIDAAIVALISDISADEVYTP